MESQADQAICYRNIPQVVSSFQGSDLPSAFRLPLVSRIESVVLPVNIRKKEGFYKQSLDFNSMPFG